MQWQSQNIKRSLLQIHSLLGVWWFTWHLDRKHVYKLPFNFRFMLPFRKVFWPETILYQRCYHEELIFSIKILILHIYSSVTDFSVALNCLGSLLKQIKFLGPTPKGESGKSEHLTSILGDSLLNTENNTQAKYNNWSNRWKQPMVSI